MKKTLCYLGNWLNWVIPYETYNVDLVTLVNNVNDKSPEKLFNHNGFFGEQTSDLTLEKANYLENLLVYINQASISPLKNNEEAIYVVNVVLAQLLPLVNCPPDIENYVCKENEVKLLCPLYDIETACFSGLEKRLAAISVRDDEDELLLSYRYSKEKCKQLFSLHKVRLPNIFQTTCFKKT